MFILAPQSHQRINRRTFPTMLPSRLVAFTFRANLVSFPNGRVMLVPLRCYCIFFSRLFPLIYNGGSRFSNSPAPLLVGRAYNITVLSFLAWWYLKHCGEGNVKHTKRTRFYNQEERKSSRYENIIMQKSNENSSKQRAEKARDREK